MSTNLVRLPSPSGMTQHSYPDGFINRKQGVERILLKRQHRAVKLGDTRECGVDDRLLQWSTVVNNVDLVRNSPGASTRKAVQGRQRRFRTFDYAHSAATAGQWRTSAPARADLTVMVVSATKPGVADGSSADAARCRP